MNDLSMSITIAEDYTEEILQALNEQAEIGLAAVGEKMEGHAKDGCPVRTGRLRDSIVYATETKAGSPGPMAQSGDSDVHGTPDELEVQVGTNVKYAPVQEYGDSISHKTGGAHFLRNAASGHTDEYKSTLEAALSS